MSLAEAPGVASQPVNTLHTWPKRRPYPENTIRVLFEILEGEGSLSVVEKGVTGGIAATRLTSRTAGVVTVRASAAGVESATVSVDLQSGAFPETVGALDFSGDGKVDFTDFLAFAHRFGKRTGEAGYDAKFDLDRDGEVGFGDFLTFVQGFESTQQGSG